MTDFVLVHGSFQGGGIWQSTAAELRRRLAGKISGTMAQTVCEERNDRV